MATKFRKEKDSLGYVEVPANVYYGVQTQRAVENYPISGLREHPALIDAFVSIKRAAAVVNGKLGVLPQKKARAIVRAADEVLGGALREQFVVDVFQAGAGTSFNMNVNEVLANRANELLGGKKGEYKPVGPNDDVNMSQSTNDTFPTAMRVSSLLLLSDLMPVLEDLKKTFAKKGKEFDKILKSGRTHLQDAVPMRLGQEFTAYATCITRHMERLNDAAFDLCELGIGGTAVGTGLNAHPKYRGMMAKELAKELGFPFREGRDYFELMQSSAPLVNISAAMKNLALDVTRIASDLRLLSSGPTTGLKEILLPSVQPGSSIMPGKVNPSILEMVNQVCWHVIGSDTAVSYASQAGQMELNVMMPGMIFEILFSMEVMKNALVVFMNKCVAGITADKARCEWYAGQSASIVTALNPIIGYMKAAEIAKEAVATGKTVREVVIKNNIMTAAQFDKVVDMRKLTEPGIHE